MSTEKHDEMPAATAGCAAAAGYVTDTECTDCGGLGGVTRRVDPPHVGSYHVECPHCKGTGKIASRSTENSGSQTNYFNPMNTTSHPPEKTAIENQGAEGCRAALICSAAVAADMLRAMDALWGALDAAHDLLGRTVDAEDGRIVTMGVALVTAQDLLTPYFENGKVIMPSQMR